MTFQRMVYSSIWVILKATEEPLQKIGFNLVLYIKRSSVVHQTF